MSQTLFWVVYFLLGAALLVVSGLIIFASFSAMYYAVQWAAGV